MKGFTLIETLIAIVIFVLAMGTISGLVVRGYQIYSFTSQQSHAIGEARRGVATMVKEIREAKQGDDGAYTIEIADDFVFIFYSDIDRDGETERVRYFVDGNMFKKGVTDPTNWPIKYELSEEKIFILSKYVTNLPPIFRYFDGNGNELPSPARLKDTKLMRVYLVINIDPNRPPEDFVLESDVQLRNLKTNL